MRDPKRIGAMLELLGNIWKKQPDLRLGQLILNIINDPSEHSFLYNMEDEELAAELKKLYG